MVSLTTSLTRSGIFAERSALRAPDAPDHSRARLPSSISIPPTAAPRSGREVPRSASADRPLMATTAAERLVHFGERSVSSPSSCTRVREQVPRARSRYRRSSLAGFCSARLRLRANRARRDAVVAGSAESRPATRNGTRCRCFRNTPSRTFAASRCRSLPRPFAAVLPSGGCWLGPAQTTRNDLSRLCPTMWKESPPPRWPQLDHQFKNGDPDDIGRQAPDLSPQLS